MKLYYTYVLQCADGKHYIGSSSDIEQRVKEHANGDVPSTKSRRPVPLAYYEVCSSKTLALKREEYFKTGFGRRFLKERIADD